MTTRQVLIEHDGALFGGISRGHPEEVWSPIRRAWIPYAFDGEHKPVEWGSEITASEARSLMSDVD